MQNAATPFLVSQLTHLEEARIQLRTTMQHCAKAREELAQRIYETQQFVHQSWLFLYEAEAQKRKILLNISKNHAVR